MVLGEFRSGKQAKNWTDSFRKNMLTDCLTRNCCWDDRRTGTTGSVPLSISVSMSCREQENPSLAQAVALTVSDAASTDNAPGFSIDVRRFHADASVTLSSSGLVCSFAAAYSRIATSEFECRGENRRGFQLASNTPKEDVSADMIFAAMFEENLFIPRSSSICSLVPFPKSPGEMWFSSPMPIRSSSLSFSSLFLRMGSSILFCSPSSVPSFCCKLRKISKARTSKAVASVLSPSLSQLVTSIGSVDSASTFGLESVSLGTTQSRSTRIQSM
ncbi:unnamed protein product [Pseudo-nitzschia multistriata]|uniref:Uncharacterized protein n=1 Tax=Pseudo-nitzschia multistriata TaxID=183589 RepID=A0A448ZAK1_9STRA|nr:unnamed protein product [Pseudo-nitzschia multistriata]